MSTRPDASEVWEAHLRAEAKRAEQRRFRQERTVVSPNFRRIPTRTVVLGPHDIISPEDMNPPEGTAVAFITVTKIKASR